MELAILKLFSKKENYEQHIDKIKDSPLSRESQWVLNRYKSWFKDKDSDVDFTTFKDYCFFVINHELKEDKVKIYSDLIDKVAQLDTDVTEDILHSFKLQDKAGDVIAQCEDYISGVVTREQLSDTLEETKELLATESNTDYELISMMRDEEDDGEITFTPWAIPYLNECTAGLTGGNLVIVFARSNVGKTSFVVQETCNRYIQLSKYSRPGPVLWVNNEESFSKSIENRILSYLSGHNSSKISKNIEGKRNLKKQIFNKYGEVYTCLEGGKQSRDVVEKIVSDINPCCVVFNNLDKIEPRKGDRVHTQLGDLYRWARNLSISYDTPVFAVCQASGDAQGQRVLYQTMTQDSKTDKAGEADLMIGLGTDAYSESVDGKLVRYLNVAKNKLTEGTVHGMREIYGKPMSFDIGTGSFTVGEQSYD